MAEASLHIITIQIITIALRIVVWVGQRKEAMFPQKKKAVE